MYKLIPSNKFRKDYEKAASRGCDVDLLDEILIAMAAGDSLAAKYRDHALKGGGEYRGCRECHVTPDWLLVYKVAKEIHIISLVRTGSHSDLF